MSLFNSQTGETNGRLTSSTMLLGEFDSEFMEDFSVVSLKGTVQSTVTIDDDETKDVFVFQEFLQILFFAI